MLALVLVFSSAAFATEKFDKQLEQFNKDVKRKDQNKVFGQFLKDYWVYAMETYPEWASMVGYPGQNHRLGDNSMAAIQERKKLPARLLTLLRKFNRSKMTSDNQLTLDLLITEAEWNSQSAQFPDEFLAINQMGNVASGFSEILIRMQRLTAQDFQDRLSRMHAFPTQLKNNRQLLREGLKQGITPYRVALAKTVTSLKEMTPKDISMSPFYASFKDLPTTIPLEQQTLLQNQAKAVIKDIIYPEMKSYTAFVEKEYIPKTRSTWALTDLPNGKAWYDLAIKISTTIPMTADEAHDLGLKEVARLGREMEKVQKQVKFSGNLEQFIAHLRTTPKHKFSSADDMITSYRAISKAIDAKVPQLFNLMPRLPYGVEPVPAYKAKASPQAYYDSGSLETGIAGTFYLNTHNAKTQDRWEAESLIMHEAVPGHHFQIALAHELKNLPEVRRYNNYTSYAEGWALYAETLGYEMGFYKDPYMRFGQLSNEIWRACRLVVDTGLHAKGWTRQQAIDYMMKYLAKTESAVAVEVDRYIVMPAQALAYKVGQLKIAELRAKAEKALGKQFSVRHFHDQILNSGPLPLPVLEKKIDEWIASQQQETKHAGM